MLDTQLIAFLINKHLHNELTTEESLLFREWLNADAENVKLLSELEASDKVFADLSVYNRITARQQEGIKLTALTEKIKERIRQDEKQPKRIKTRSKRSLSWIKYAAAILIFCTSAYFYIRQTSDVPRPSETNHSTYLSDIAPGTNRAILKLPNGQTIDLDNDSDGIVADNTSISYADGRKIEIANRSTPQNAMVTLEVPLRGQYHVTLSDGTKVWVNAGSKLHYPLYFEGDQRAVELEGEAYFEVSTDEIPFIVKSKNQTLEVLGTKFNILADDERKEIITTLIDGKVALGGENIDEASIVLTPGQQSIFNGKRFSKRKVDVEQFIAWKNGQFYFDGVSPEEAFSQLAKWYDIDIIYEGKTPKFEFFGIIDRNKNLSGVLDILRKSGLNFRLEVEETQRKLVIQGEQTY